MLKKLFTIILAFALICVSTTVVFATGDDLELLPSEEYNLGDVNTDGKINVNDVTVILRCFVKLITLDSYQLELADVNQDGYVSIGDVLCIQKLIVNTVYPIQPTETTTKKDDYKPIELPFVPAS